MDRGVYVSRSEAESTTLAEALDRYIEEHIPRLSRTNGSKYVALALKKRAIASKYLAAIRSKDIADFIKERENEGVKGAPYGSPLPCSPSFLILLSGTGEWKACETL
jgi:hypothetical protein